MNFIMNDGSTLNLHSQISLSTFNSYNDESSYQKLLTVNLYQPLSNFNDPSVQFFKLNNIIFNAYESIGLGQLLLDNTTLNLHNNISLRQSGTNTSLTLQNNSTLNFYSGKIVFHGAKNIDVETSSALNLCPRGKNEYIGVFNESTPSQECLIGAYKGRNPDGLFKQMNSDRHIVMLKMTAIVMDEESGKHTVHVDELPSFTYSFTTTPELDGFTVQYCKSGDSVWTADMPTEPGTYDVKITRPMDYKSGQLSDPDHLPFEQVIRDGLTIDLRTIEYTSPEPQALVYDGKAHNLRVTVTTPADATVTYTSDTGAPIGYPAFTDAGDYTVNYTLSRTNYNPETGTLRLRTGGHPQGEEALSRL